MFNNHHHHIIIKLTLIITIITLSPPATSAQPPPSFKCSTKSTCKALIGYISPNKTTLSNIQKLFQVKTLRTLLGVNNLPPTTPSNFSVAANATVTIPFPCRCFNGTGVSNKVPKYKVVKDDGLYHIAAKVFSGLVTFQQIQAANGIADPNKILVGQELWVPLPCSCDDVAGLKVVHYGHVVASGSSIDQIAAEFGANSRQLMDLNGIKNAKDLIAGQVLDIPLRACNSSVLPTSFDYPLLVPNGTYVDTAHNCVMCKCDISKSLTLECEPSGLKAVDWPTCPAMKCSGSNLSLGNATDSKSCSSSTCSYAGFAKNQSIFTTLAPSICPGETSPPSKGNGVSKINSRSWSFITIILCIQLVLLHKFL